jgi:hypothetical protein
MSSEIHFGVYLSSKSGATLEFSPLPSTRGGEAHPAHASMAHMTLTTALATAPTDLFGSAASCVIYEVIMRRRT